MAEYKIENDAGLATIIDLAASAYDYPLLLKHLLTTALARAPTQEIVYRDLVRHDYRTLNDRVGRLAAGLTAFGLKAGSVIGVLDWDSHRYLEGYFAIPGMGAVLHTVNIRLSPEQILYTINHAADDALLVHVDFLPMLESIWDRVETVRTIIVITDDGRLVGTSLPIAGEYEAILEAASPDFPFPDFDENSRATTFYTTGTTGLPKGVFFSHRQLVLHTLALATTLAASTVQGRLHRDDVYMPITPMFHVHAWGLPYIATMLGLKQVYPGRYAADTLIALQQAEKVTFSHCVPTLLHMLLTSPEGAAADLTGWKVIVGGSALSKGLAYAALERGIDVFTGYGMSETCPVLSIAHVESDQLKDGVAADVEIRTRAGMPVPLVELQIVDADMRPVAHDGESTGEVIARAPWLTKGYLGDPRSSQALWQGGYLHTNDVGLIHPDGYLQIADRMKDVIKTGGEWISSLEIEDIVSQHPSVSEVAVIGVADAKWGERPLAIVVINAGYDRAGLETSIKAHLQDFCDRGVISKWAVPATVLFCDALEKTSVGKLDKKVLRQRYG